MDDSSPRHIVAVMGLVRDAQGRILLVKTERRGWEPPGGQVELGEGLLQALQRETLEESGCVVEVGRLVGVYSNIGAPEKVMFTFVCAYHSGEPAPSPETTEVGWFTVDEALRLVTFPAQRDKLRDALEACGAESDIIYRVYRTNPYQVLAERHC